MVSVLGRDRMVLLSSHIVADIEHVADQILLMEAGRVLKSGNLQEVLKLVEGKGVHGAAGASAEFETGLYG